MNGGNGDQRPHIRVEISGVKLLGLLDSEADCNMWWLWALDQCVEYRINITSVKFDNTNSRWFTSHVHYSIQIPSPNTKWPQTHQLRKLIMPNTPYTAVLWMLWREEFQYGWTLSNIESYQLFSEIDRRQAQSYTCFGAHNRHNTGETIIGVIEPKNVGRAQWWLSLNPSGNIRWCMDSRKLNEVTVKDSYSIPYMYMTGILGNLRET